MVWLTSGLVTVNGPEGRDEVISLTNAPPRQPGSRYIHQ